jgi:hypothetical protein
MEEIQNKAAGLFHTLFTATPQEVRQAAREHAEGSLRRSRSREGLGGMMARAIHPLIDGADGQGGIAGVFKGISSAAASRTRLLGRDRPEHGSHGARRELGCDCTH